MALLPNGYVLRSSKRPANQVPTVVGSAAEAKFSKVGDEPSLELPRDRGGADEVRAFAQRVLDSQLAHRWNR